MITTLGQPTPNPGQAVFRATTRDFLIVSQCCTIENGSHVALVPIRQTAPLSLDEQRSYMWESVADVPEDSTVQFAFSALALDPIDGVLDDPGGNRLRVADFEDTLSYSGGHDELVSHRVAQMTPRGRLRLRTRLMYFWGRPEATDEATLAADQ